MNRVPMEQESYEMPPRDGFTVTHFLTVADIDQSARFNETVLGGRIESSGDSKGAPGYIQIAILAHGQRRGRPDPRRRAEFITEPKDRYGETRCHIRDPDSYIIEVGQSKPDFTYR